MQKDIDFFLNKCLHTRRKKIKAHIIVCNCIQSSSVKVIHYRTSFTRKQFGHKVLQNPD